MISRQLLSVARLAAARPLAARAAPLAARSFSRSAVRANTKVSDPAATAVEADDHAAAEPPAPAVSMSIDEVESEMDLFGPGATKGKVPTNLEQATGLERLELLADMAGIDLFDQVTLPSDRKGTIFDPVVIQVPVKQKYIGCTGIPADTHEIEWMSATIRRPARCVECGCVYRLEYVGPAHEAAEDGHHH
ncbi:cytochrome c oxidase polypeptide IV [Myxozyma melibiosi]|uniref:Cytochrome c oxidase polypeptide IV n=1 Tax=Myxozyma melibiosi TaxID=54550 RepID=A0ABR1FDE5_9ASCO